MESEAGSLLITQLKYRMLMFAPETSGNSTSWWRTRRMDCRRMCSSVAPDTSCDVFVSQIFKVGHFIPFSAGGQSFKMLALFFPNAKPNYFEQFVFRFLAGTFSIHFRSIFLFLSSTFCKWTFFAFVAEIFTCGLFFFLYIKCNEWLSLLHLFRILIFFNSSVVNESLHLILWTALHTLLCQRRFVAVGGGEWFRGELWSLYTLRSKFLGNLRFWGEFPPSPHPRLWIYQSNYIIWLPMCWYIRIVREFIFYNYRLYILPFIMFAIIPSMWFYVSDVFENGLIFVNHLNESRLIFIAAWFIWLYGI